MYISHTADLCNDKHESLGSHYTLIIITDVSINRKLSSHLLKSQKAYWVLIFLLPCIKKIVLVDSKVAWIFKSSTHFSLRNSKSAYHKAHYAKKGISHEQQYAAHLYLRSIRNKQSPEGCHDFWNVHVLTMTVTSLQWKLRNCSGNIYHIGSWQNN